MDGLSQVVRVLEAQGWLWVELFKVSKPAIAKRLTCLPTELLGQIFELVMVKILSLADKLPIPIAWESVYQN
jgi:hypothetical protein